MAACALVDSLLSVRDFSFVHVVLACFLTVRCFCMCFCLPEPVRYRGCERIEESVRSGGEAGMGDVGNILQILPRFWHGRLVPRCVLCVVLTMPSFLVRKC